MRHKPTAKLWAHVPGVSYPDAPPMSDCEISRFLDNKPRNTTPNKGPRPIKGGTIRKGTPESREIARKAWAMVRGGRSITDTAAELGFKSRTSLKHHMNGQEP